MKTMNKSDLRIQHMRAGDLLRTGCVNLWRRKTRTILTALSMTVGVMCIVVLISVGIGYGRSYEESVASMGSLTKIDVTPQTKMNDSQKSALLNDKAVNSFKGIDGVEAVTPVEQSTGYLKSGNYIAIAKLYGIDLSTAESFLLTPVEGIMPEAGLRLHPELMVTDDLAKSFADPNRNWEDAVDADGNPLVDPLSSPIKLTFDYNTLNGEQTADKEGRATQSGTFYNLDITGVCSSLNYTYATSAFLDKDRLKEWKDAVEKQTSASSSNSSTSGSSSGNSSGSTDNSSTTNSGTNSNTNSSTNSGTKSNTNSSTNSGTKSNTNSSTNSSDTNSNSNSGTGNSTDTSNTGTTANSSSTSGNTQGTRSTTNSRDTERAAVGSQTSSSSSSSARGGSSNPALKDTYDLVWIKAEKVSDVERICKLVQDAGFETTSLNDMLEAVKKQSRQIQGMLGAIGLMALLVAGFGVANTMMMSINERTREVGILKVMGMEFSDIARMFLTEALLVGLTGGVAGLLLSFLMGRIIPVLFADQGIRCIFPWWLMAGGVLFAGLVALLAAWIPAKRAMNISPNEAIRTE